MSGDGPAGAIPSAVGYGALLSQAWHVYRRAWRPVVGLYLPVLALLLALQLLVSAIMGEPDDVVTVAVAVLTQLVLPTFAGTFLVAGAQSVYIDLVVAREAPSTRSSLATLGPLRGALSQSALVAVLFALVVSFLPVLGLLYFALWGPPIVVSAIILERVAVGEAWTRTQPRMRGNWARVLVLIVAGALIAFAVPLTAAAVAALLASTTGWGFWAYAVTLGLLDAIAFPWLAAVTLLLYFDTRVRSEGFDFDQLRAARAGPPPA